MKKFLALALVLVCSSANAGYIDFVSVPPSDASGTNNFNYNGLGGALTATNVPITSLIASGTNGSLLNNTQYSITNGLLNFTTGNYLNDLNGTGWTFASGGSLTITGSVPDAGIGATTLFSGVFTEQTTILSFNGGYKVIGGGYRGSFDPILASKFNINQSPINGGLSLILNTTSLPGFNIQGTTYGSGNLMMGTTPFNGGAVPEPASLAMTGLGIAGLAFLRKRMAA